MLNTPFSKQEILFIPNGTIHCRFNKYPILTWNDLSKKEQEENQECDPCGPGCQHENRFFRYKNWVYNLSDFLFTPTPFCPFWTAYKSDSYFSGILVHYCKDDDDSLIVGRYCV